MTGRPELPAGARVPPPAGYLDLHDAGGVGVADTDRFRRVQNETVVLGIACRAPGGGTELPITLTEGTKREAGCRCDRH